MALSPPTPDPSTHQPPPFPKHITPSSDDDDAIDVSSCGGGMFFLLGGGGRRSSKTWRATDVTVSPHTRRGETLMKGGGEQMGAREASIQPCCLCIAPPSPFSTLAGSERRRRYYRGLEQPLPTPATHTPAPPPLLATGSPFWQLIDRRTEVFSGALM